MGILFILKISYFQHPKRETHKNKNEISANIINMVNKIKWKQLHTLKPMVNEPLQIYIHIQASFTVTL